MRTFILRRDVDVSNVSGTGDVAQGVQFDDGVVAMKWRDQPLKGIRSSVAVWPDIDSVIACHEHDGKTRVVWS